MNPGKSSGCDRARFGKALAASLSVSLAIAGAALGQYGASNGEWHTWGGDAGFTRYAPLDQIDRDNVGRLEIVWRWRALPLDGRPDGNLKATPLLVDGVLYTPTGVHQVAAIDPKTGETRWIFSPLPADIGGRNLSLSSRSLAYWTDGRAKRLFHNTLDGRLLAIDAQLGEPALEFGNEGTVLLKEQLVDRPVPFVGSSSPALVVGDVVIAQVVADITAPNKEATPGFVRGYDVRTGKLLWTFHTIPQEGEHGNDTWENGSWKYSGNTGVWTMMSADLELGYVYLPVEAPTHDFYGGQRLGDNLFSQSLVCLDASTGKRVWHFQMVHHDVWDYDPPAAPILGDIVVGGRRVRAVMQVTKQGMTFVFDRVTGEPVWPIEERPVPASDVPGERLSPTQPFATKPPPYDRLGFHEDDLIDFTPELRAEALAIAAQYVRGPMYTPTSRVVPGGSQGTWVYPGYGGGANWNGGAFDPEQGMLYVPTRNQPMIASLTPADPKLTNWDYIRATTQVVRGPRGLPINKPPWSKITATDMNAGEHRWSRAIGPAPDYVREHPDLQGLGLDFESMGYFGVRPGPLATRTLLFLAEAGNLSGDPGGPMLRAYDKSTGEVVAEIELPAKASGAPMTYLHQGKQYIVIAVATAQHPAELVALALRDEELTEEEVEEELPDREQGGEEAEPGAALSAARPDSVAEPSVARGPQDELREGRSIYALHCALCHGSRGQGVRDAGPSLAGWRDLAQILRAVERGGVEMPAMATLLTAEQIAQVSQFVASEFGGLEP